METPDSGGGGDDYDAEPWAYRTLFHKGRHDIEVKGQHDVVHCGRDSAFPVDVF
jgi:hypothetical protein